MFRNVFIGVDGTSHGRDAIALAAVLAEPGARLTLAHVQPGISPAEADDRDLSVADPTDPTYYAGAGVESHDLLEAERESAGVDADLVTIAGPSVGPALHALAEQRGADLLVVGACKHRLVGRIMIGDDTRASVSGAACPVAIAPAGYAATRTLPSTIGVGSDSLEDGAAVLAVACDLAARHGSKIISLDLDGHVAPGESSGTPASPPAHVDLLVLGPRGGGSLRRLVLGSSPLRIARHAHSPMIVMPHADVARKPSAQSDARAGAHAHAHAHADAQAHAD